MASPSSRERLDANAILSNGSFAFRGAVKPIYRGVSFHLWLLAVAVVMVILPGIYFGLMLLDLAFLTWFASVVPAILSHVTGKGVYLGIVGVFLAAFAFLGMLLLPLARGWGDQPKPFVLDPKRCPKLFDLVYNIAKQVRAPVPAAIHLTCDANASAHLVSLWGDSLVLTLGLPFIACMDLPQLAAVIAHELAHFRQSKAMRLSAVVARSQRWFAHVLGDESGWDLVLSVTVTRSVFGVTAIFLRIIQPLLWVLCQASHVVSLSLSRKMEFDADRYAARLVGSKAAAGMMDAICVIGKAQDQALSSWKQAWMGERKLFDNMPGLVISALDKLSEDDRREIVEHTARQKTNVMDTHPADSARVASILGEKAEGALVASGPARQLVDGFEQLCRDVTIWEYKARKLRFTNDNLLSAQQVERARQKEEEDLSPLESFYQGIVTHLCPLSLENRIDPLPRDAATTARIRSIRQAVRQGLAEARLALEALLQADTRLQVNDQAEAMLSAGLPVPDGLFSEPMGDDQASEAVRRQATGQFNSASSAIGSFNSALSSRLRAVIGLLAPQADEGLPESADRYNEALRLLGFLRTFPQWGPALARLRRVCTRLTALAKAHRKGHNGSLLPYTIDALCNHAGKDLLEFRKQLGDHGYPFDDMPPRTLLADYAVLETGRDVESIIHQTGQAAERMSQLYRRVLARLGQIAEEEEFSLGLAPLPVQPKT